jgi:hypothetical protein
MSRKRFSAEQIIQKLREVEVELAKGPLGRRDRRQERRKSAADSGRLVSATKKPANALVCGLS